MKKFMSVLMVVLAIIMCMTMLVACNTPEDDTGDDGDKVTVCWYEGSKLLKEEKIDKGSKVTSWTPTSDSGTFDGWYAEASKTTPFDFDAVINEDTDIFAKFRSDEFVADTNEYYLIGAGAGDMGKANWDHTNAAANLPFVKDTSVTNANVYKITLTLYAGDRFQICYGGTWDGQVGIGYVEGAEYCDGKNEYDNNDYVAADKKVAQVKDAEGNVVFVGSDEYNKGFEVWNVILAAGMDGKYEITYTTYPNAKDYNTITYKLIEKVEPMATTHDMQLVGTFNNWDPANEDELYAMKKSEDGSFWTAILRTTEAVEFKVVNQINSGWYSPDGNNISLTEAGTYAVKYTVEGDVVQVAKCDYYIVGTFADGEGAAVNFCIKDGVTPKLVADGDVFKVTFEAKDITAMNDYSWIKDQNKPGIMAIKVVLGSELAIADWFSDDANNGDNFYLEAGSHTVTFDPATKTVTIG